MLKDNSKKINKGDTFIAIGEGHNYIDEAIKNGATTIIAEYGEYKVKTVLVPNTKKYLIEYLDNKYKKDSKKIIGVTGTNGKTTTSFLLYQALNKVSTCTYIGTIGLYSNNKKIKDLDNTTPGLIELYDYVYNNESEYVVMEVSSHALDQDRIGNIEYDYIIYTNITQDHLDYHKTMENYFNAKLKLINHIKHNGKIILNYDDNYLKTIKHTNIIKISKDINIKNINIKDNYQEFTFNENKYKTYLLGEHNIYNTIPSIIILESLNIKDVNKIIETLEPPKGRMEIINDDTNKIIIDYAHTPDAVKQIINTVKTFSKGKIYVIIGCGGNRDKTKRPIMAKIATDLADYAIFTSDNPRNEEPIEIINDMIKNLDNSNYEIELNREKAIIKGIQKLNINDILMILGKGHETYQIINNNKVHFDDKEIVIKNI